MLENRVLRNAVMAVLWIAFYTALHFSPLFVSKDIGVLTVLIGGIIALSGVVTRNDDVGWFLRGIGILTIIFGTLALGRVFKELGQ